MRDPVVSQVLRDLQADTTGAAFQKVMQNKDMGPKIEKLIASGVLSVG